MSEILNLTRGIYRRIYAGFISGKRINSISMEAEAWFWRLLVMADDFGNLPADPGRLAAQGGYARRLSPRKAKALTDQCVGVGLVSIYTHNGDNYLSITDFERLQPANRNGRRIQRYPLAPQQLASGGESGGIRGNPVPPIPTPNPYPIPNPIPNPTTANVGAAEPPGKALQPESSRAAQVGGSGGWSSDGVKATLNAVGANRQLALRTLGVNKATADELVAHPLCTAGLIRKIALEAAARNGDINSRPGWLVGAIRGELKRARGP